MPEEDVVTVDPPTPADNGEAGDEPQDNSSTKSSLKVQEADPEESGDVTPIADKYKSRACSNPFEFQVEPPVDEAKEAELAKAVENLDTFDFSPPESLKLSETPVVLENCADSPFSDGQSPLPIDVLKKEAIESDSDSSPEDDIGALAHLKKQRRILIGAIVSLIAILVPCFVMMVYLVAVRSHLVRVLSEMGVQGNLPLGASVVNTPHPVMNYDQHDPVLVSLLDSNSDYKFYGLRYEPRCSSSQQDLARQLAALALHTKYILLDTSKCETTKEEVLGLISDLKLDLSVTLVCALSPKEHDAVTAINDTIQLARAFPKIVQTILLRPSIDMTCSEVEFYVIYLQRNLAVRLPGVEVSVHPTFEVWSRDLLNLIEIIGINYSAEHFGSSPKQTSHWIAHDLSNVARELKDKELLVTGIGWPTVEDDVEYERMSNEFLTSWICKDQPNLSPRVRWFYESGLDGSPVASNFSLFDPAYNLKYSINC